MAGIACKVNTIRPTGTLLSSRQDSPVVSSAVCRDPMTRARIGSSPTTGHHFLRIYLL